MKLSFKPIAAAITFALAAASAHAALPTATYASSAPTTSAGSAPVILSIFDPTTHANFSEAVNLSLAFSDMTSAAFTSGTDSAFKSATVNGQQVEQLDFGVVPNYLATFGANDSTATYWLTGYSGNAATGVGASQQVLVTQPLSATPTLPNGTFPTVGTITGVNTAATKWLPNWGSGGSTLDTSGSVDNNNTGSSNWGSILANAFLSQPTGTTVGSALNMYDLNKNNKVSAGTAAVVTELGNTSGAGFWFLDAATGDLSWNLTVSSVPLPAAAWLLLSGLAGLGAVGRRRFKAEAA